MGDGWRGEETPLNKIGTSITVMPAVFCAILLFVASDFVPVEYLFIVVGLGGLVGGALNVHGRGPEAAGAAIGLLIALGGFGAVYYWLNFRGEDRIWWFEIAIAMIVGAIPGIVAQFAIQKMLGVKGEEEAPKRTAKGGMKPMRRV